MRKVIGACFALDLDARNHNPGLDRILERVYALGPGISGVTREDVLSWERENDPDTEEATLRGLLNGEIRPEYCSRGIEN